MQNMEKIDDYDLYFHSMEVLESKKRGIFSQLGVYGSAIFSGAGVGIATNNLLHSLIIAICVGVFMKGFLLAIDYARTANLRKFLISDIKKQIDSKQTTKNVAFFISLFLTLLLVAVDVFSSYSISNQFLDDVANESLKQNKFYNSYLSEIEENKNLIKEWENRKDEYKISYKRDRNIIYNTAKRDIILHQKDREAERLSYKGYKKKQTAIWKLGQWDKANPKPPSALKVLKEWEKTHLSPTQWEKQNPKPSVNLTKDPKKLNEFKNKELNNANYIFWIVMFVVMLTSILIQFLAVFKDYENWLKIKELLSEDKDGTIIKLIEKKRIDTKEIQLQKRKIKDDFDKKNRELKLEEGIRQELKRLGLNEAELDTMYPLDELTTKIIKSNVDDIVKVQSIFESVKQITSSLNVDVNQLQMLQKMEDTRKDFLLNDYKQKALAYNKINNQIISECILKFTSKFPNIDISTLDWKIKKNMSGGKYLVDKNKIIIGQIVIDKNDKKTIYHELGHKAIQELFRGDKDALKHRFGKMFKYAKSISEQATISIDEFLAEAIAEWLSGNYKPFIKAIISKLFDKQVDENVENNPIIPKEKSELELNFNKLFYHSVKQFTLFKKERVGKIDKRWLDKFVEIDIIKEENDTYRTQYSYQIAKEMILGWVEKNNSKKNNKSKKNNNSKKDDKYYVELLFSQFFKSAMGKKIDNNFLSSIPQKVLKEWLDRGIVEKIGNNYHCIDERLGAYSKLGIIEK